MTERDVMQEKAGTMASIEDELQAPYYPHAQPRLGDVTQIHERYPGLAAFRERIGGTPLIDAPSVPGGAAIVAKCEWGNPAGSIKDRAAYGLVCQAIKNHGPRPAEDLRLLEYSGGNLGLALSALCADIGVPLRLIVASFTSESVLDALRSRGTMVDIAPEEEGFLGTIRAAQRIAATDPGWQLLFQHVNPVNVMMHELTTGQELVRQLAGRKPHTWIAAIGTGGTLIGVLNALRRVYPDVRAVGVTPAESPYGYDGPPRLGRAFCGSGGFGYGIRQPFVKAHEDQIAGHYHVPYEETLAGAAEFLSLTGIRIGTSAAANWLVARRIAAELPSDAVVATVFADAGTPEQWAEVGA
jgi:cysteine synthase A